MDIKQILYFKAVADSGSFAKASDRLHISQPAISAQIGQLETELNTELLIRHARGSRPPDRSSSNTAVTFWHALSRPGLLSPNWVARFPEA